MMIEPAYPGAVPECAFKGATIGVDRDIEYSDFIATLYIHPVQQCDVAFDPAHENSVARCAQAKLQQGAQAISIAVVDIIEFQ